MADLTIEIPYPILIGTEKFKVRYRLLPVGTFSSYQDEDNDPFTLTGLTSGGTYEIEYIYVKEDGTECPAVTQLRQVPEDFECIEFAAEIQQIGSLWNLQITYTPPATDPSCGWRIQWVQGSSSATIPYTTLPATGVINIAIPTGQNVNLTITADLCNGEALFCFEDQIEGIPVPTCTPAVLVSADLKYNSQISTNPLTWFIRLQVINSNPMSKNYVLNVSETSFTGTLPPFNGTYIIPAQQLAGAFFYGASQVYPNGIFLQGFPGEYLPNCISFAGTLTDDCGVSHPFSVSGYFVPDGTQTPGQGTFYENGC